VPLNSKGTLMLKNLILCAVVVFLSGCTMANRMVSAGYPPAYANGYSQGRGYLLPVPTEFGTPMYDRGFTDGERDKAAGMAGDPPPPAFPGR